MIDKIRDIEKFKKMLIAALMAIIEESGEDLQVIERKMTKVNEVLQCINIEPAGDEPSCSPNFYIEEYYGMYEEGRSIESIAAIIMDLYRENKMCRHIRNADPADRDNADRVILMLINRKGNEDLLKKIPHRDFLDLTVIYRVVLSSDEDSIMSYILTDAILESWEMTEEEIYQRALVQTDSILPANDTAENNIVIFTNASGVNGDSAFLMHRRLERAAEWFGGDFYIVPSSINELIGIPVNGASENAVRQAVIHSVDNGIVEPSEWLSYSLYRYEKDKGRVIII